MAALESAFVEGGGYSEQLATARLAHRRKKDQPALRDPADSVPPCPRCGALMALRIVKNGKNAGSQFWGCTKYPDCKGTAEV